MKEAFFISTDKSLLDPHLIHQFLHQTYWAKGLPLPNLMKRIDNSLCFGVYNAHNQQVGFARVISDFESFAYLADVFILPEYRKIGLSKKLMAYIMSYPDLQHLKRFMLATQDAHTLYESFGFKTISNPERWMEISHPDIYLKNE